MRDPIPQPAGGLAADAAAVPHGLCGLLVLGGVAAPGPADLWLDVARGAVGLWLIVAAVRAGQGRGARKP